MGSCTSKQQQQAHERLNEVDEKFFARLDTPNSVESRRRWWNTNLQNNGRSLSGIEVNTLDGNPSLLPAQPWTLSSSEGEPSPPTQDGADAQSPTFAFTGTRADASIKAQYISSSQFSTPTSSSMLRPAIKTSSHEQVSGWQSERQGHALQLRLAKHRFLQMAETRQSSPNGSPVSPVSLDSTLRMIPSSQDSGLTDIDHPINDWSPLSTRTKTIRGKDASIQNEDGPRLNFDAAQGMIWKEISRDHKVTAIAMSRTTDVAHSLQTYPLMMAMGDEQGNIVLTQIIDELVAAASPGGQSSWPDTQLDLLPSEALKYSIDERVRSLDFANGGYLAVGGDGCSALILEIILDGSNQRLKDLVPIYKVERVDRIYAVRFSPDNRYLAVGGFDGMVALIPMEEVWKTNKTEIGSNGEDDDSLSEIMRSSLIELDSSGLVYSLDWSPAGEYLAVAGSDKSCSIYETKGFDLVHETACRSTAIQAVQWNQNGTFLAIGDREVVIIEGKPPFNIHCEISHTPNESTMTHFRSRITSLCWSPSGSYLAIGGVDGICLVIETKGYALVHEVHRTDSICALAWGQQRNLTGDMRRYLALSDEDCNVALVKAGAEAKGYETFDDHSSVASSSQFSAASEWILREDTFRDLDEAEPDMLPADFKAQASNVTALAFSKSGKSKVSSYLAFACDDCSLTIMTTRDWKPVFQIEFAKPIRSLVFSNSNNYLALGGDEGVLYVLSVPSRSMILSTIFPTPVQSVVFSKRDERLSIGLKDGVLSLLSPAAEWEPVGEIEHSESCITCQDWTTKTLAIGRKDGSVTLFDAEKAFSNFFVPIAEFFNSLPVRSVAFASDGRFLSIGGDNGIVSILSGKGGWILCNQINLKCNILSTKWSPAGRYVAFAGSDNVFCVQDTITWVALNEVKDAHSSIFPENVHTVSCIDWSLDSKWVAIGGAGSGIHVLSTSNWKLLDPFPIGINLAEPGRGDA